MICLSGMTVVSEDQRITKGQKAPLMTSLRAMARRVLPSRMLNFYYGLWSGKAGGGRRVIWAVFGAVRLICQ